MAKGLKKLMEQFLEKQIENVIKKVYQSSAPFLTHFLSSLGQEMVLNEVKKYPLVNVKFFGGGNETEYQKAYIYVTTVPTNADFKITILAFNFNKRYLHITHRNVLGTLMSLGLNRNRIGDIRILDDKVLIIVSNEIVDFLLINFTTIHGYPIKLVKEGFNESFKPKTVEKNIYAASLRIDGIIAHTYNIARDEAQNLFALKSVKLNQAILSKYTMELKENDIVSVKGKGKFKVLNYNKSKKERYILKVLIYS